MFAGTSRTAESILMQMNSYLKPTLSADLPHYVARKSILYFMKMNVAEFSGTVVDLGCGNMPYKELVLSQKNVQHYISIDVAQSEFYKNSPDIIWNGKEIPLADNSVDVVLFTEVIEHLAEPLAVCKEVNRVLRVNGKIIGTTPFFWPIHEAPNDIQRFTPFGLQKVLENAGFKEIRILAPGGWRLSLAQFLCIYIGFGVNSKLVKKLLSALFYFPVLWLSRNIVATENFRNKMMINMLSFKARK